MPAEVPVAEGLHGECGLLPHSSVLIAHRHAPQWALSRCDMPRLASSPAVPHTGVLVSDGISMCCDRELW